MTSEDVLQNASHIAFICGCSRSSHKRLIPCAKRRLFKGRTPAVASVSPVTSPPEDDIDDRLSGRASAMTLALPVASPLEEDMDGFLPDPSA